MNFELTPSMKLIVEGIAKRGSLWVVGGAVRDALMGNKPKDLDLCTDLTPDTIGSIVTGLGFTCIPDAKAKEHGIIRAVDKDTGELIDIATLRRDVTTDGRHATVQFTTNIEEDLARRDLTINAMAAEITPDGEIVQLHAPEPAYDVDFIKKDLHDKVIRFVGDPAQRIQEDALRMIRACRFTALGDEWKISPRGMHSIKQHAQSIKTISKERLRDEVLKALSYSKPSNFFRALHATGLLAHVLPDVAKGVGCEQNSHHAEPVFDHLLRTVDVSVSLTDNILLRLACFLHDVAKPHTRSVDNSGSVHFYKHEVVGASHAYKWMREYKFPRADCEYVSKIIRHHQWRFNPDSKDKTYRKWLQEVGKDCWRDLITVRSADRKGNLKKAHRPMVTRQMRDLINRVDHIIKSGQPIFKEDLAINGDDLKELGIPPGRVYKEIFSNLLGIVINDPDRNTREWLLQYMTKHKDKYTNGRSS